MRDYPSSFICRFPPQSPIDNFTCLDPPPPNSVGSHVAMYDFAAWTDKWCVTMSTRALLHSVPAPCSIVGFGKKRQQYRELKGAVHNQAKRYNNHTQKLSLQSNKFAPNKVLINNNYQKWIIYDVGDGGVATVTNEGASFVLSAWLLVSQEQLGGTFYRGYRGDVPPSFQVNRSSCLTTRTNNLPITPTDRPPPSPTYSRLNKPLQQPTTYEYGKMVPYNHKAQGNQLHSHLLTSGCAKHQGCWGF